MSRLEWINIIEEPGKSAFGVLSIIDVSYIISFKRIEYLNGINNPREKKKEK